MRALILTGLCFIMVACVPMTQLERVGNKYVELGQTNNLWEDNVVVVTTCPALDNGFCPAGSPTQVVVMSGKLPSLLGSGIQGVAILGGSAIVADGLKGSKTTVKQSNKTDIRASTVNPK